MIKYKNTVAGKIVVVVDNKLICLLPGEIVEARSVVFHPALEEIVKPKKKPVKLIKQNADQTND
jgi:hypothetical protein